MKMATKFGPGRSSMGDDVENIAEAICVSYGDDWAEQCMFAKDKYRESARRFLWSAQYAGYMLVDAE